MGRKKVKIILEINGDKFVNEGISFYYEILERDEIRWGLRENN